MKVRCLLIGVVVLFVIGLLTASSYAEIDPKTCAGMWLFDEGSGTTAADSSANKNNGTLKNGPKWVDGKFGKALQFDGVNQYVDCGDSASLNITSAITIAAWVYVKGGNGAFRCIVRKGNPGNYYIAVGLNNQFVLAINDIGWDSVGIPVTENVWYHVAGTFDGKNRLMYMNGVLGRTDAQVATIGTSSLPLRIGVRDQLDQAFNGTIDEVAIFNVALNESDIKTVMTQGLASSIAAVFPSGKLTTTWGEIKAK